MGNFSMAKGLRPYSSSDKKCWHNLQVGRGKLWKITTQAIKKAIQECDFPDVVGHRQCMVELGKDLKVHSDVTEEDCAFEAGDFSFYMNSRVWDSTNHGRGVSPRVDSYLDAAPVCFGSRLDGAHLPLGTGSNRTPNHPRHEEACQLCERGVRV